MSGSLNRSFAEWQDSRYSGVWLSTSAATGFVVAPFFTTKAIGWIGAVRQCRVPAAPDVSLRLLLLARRGAADSVRSIPTEPMRFVQGAADINGESAEAHIFRLQFSNPLLQRSLDAIIIYCYTSSTFPSIFDSITHNNSSLIFFNKFKIVSLIVSQLYSSSKLRLTLILSTSADFRRILPSSSCNSSRSLYLLSSNFSR